MFFVSRFFNVFDRVLKETTGELPPSDFETLSQEMNALFKKERAVPLPPGFGAADREEALKPVILWVDEMLMNLERPDAGLWYDRSLQRTLLGTNRGGALFLENLLNLLEARKRHFYGPVFEPGSPDEPGFPFPEPSPPEEDDFPSSPEGDPLERIGAFWVRPGEGPEPGESVIDAYAMCLVLGFAGSFVFARPPGAGEAGFKNPEGSAGGSRPGDSPDSAPDARPGTPVAFSEGSGKRKELLRLARKQMSRWAIKKEKAASFGGRSFFAALADFWEERGWIFYHVLAPVVVLVILYW
ncbi:MAG: DotU family type IV/VI secretion system protein, partial [Deltaproteobacteria bacterium]|nr:DotU family type IV/VI secretion system protein [Deltaproteobacteria bacterium]